MRTLISLGLIFLIVLCFHSCGEKKESHAILRVDSVVFVLNELETNLLQLDTAKIHRYYTESNLNLVTIQKNYKDTMNRELATFLADYQSTKKSLMRLTEVFHDQLYEINYSKTQLKNLRIDLEKNLVSDLQFQEYFATELQALKTMSETTSNMVSWYENAIKSFEERNPRVEEIVKDVSLQ